ncbi:MAG: hypothetical protein M8357_00540 [Desulfobulbaceae bacterium]|nr:hypothetical protein [Desulfobulbaceae bacterium]
MGKKMELASNQGAKFINAELELAMIDIQPRLHFITDAVLRMSESFNQEEVSQEVLIGLGMVLADLRKDFAEMRRLYYSEVEKKAVNG